MIKQLSLFVIVPLMLSQTAVAETSDRWLIANINVAKHVVTAESPGSEEDDIAWVNLAGNLKEEGVLVSTSNLN